MLTASQAATLLASEVRHAKRRATRLDKECE
jgi:hypothetical protein